MTPFSPRWHRVCALRPRPVAAMRVRRQRVRGETWYLLADGVSTRSVRLNRAAYLFAARLDGQHSVQQIWDVLHASDDPDPPTQDETIDLLIRLREAGLLEADLPAGPAGLPVHPDTERPSRRRVGALSVRLPLGDPGPHLDRLARIVAPLPPRAVTWLQLVAAAALLTLAAVHAPALWAHAAAWMHTPAYLLLAALAYPPVKLLHEAAHGLAARRRGVPVRECGVTLLLWCMPLPYVDVSAAAALPRARDRVAVTAAGIAAEGMLALGGLLAWLLSEEGIGHDLGFVVFVICSASTLLFNANPLQRYDGYHLLVDAAGLPNLATRSRLVWFDLLRRRWLHAGDASPMPLARGERPWLLAYAPLAWGWQLAVGGAAVAWLAGVWIGFGAAAAVVLAWQVLLRPPLRWWHDLAAVALATSRTQRRLHATAALGAAGVLLALWLPLPQRTVVQGVLWPPEEAQLRAEADGTVRVLHHRGGEMVQAGTPVAELDNPALAAQAAAAEARVAALQSERVQAQRAGGLQPALDGALAELARTQQQLASLRIVAPRAGRLALPHADDLPGRHLHRGALLGHVQADGGPVLRIAIPQADADRWSTGLQRIEARLADGRGGTRRGALLRAPAGAASELPSAALGSAFGGAVPTDPADPHGLRTLRPVLLLDVALDGAADERIGLTGWVRFDRGHAPAAVWLAHGLRAWWLRLDATGTDR